jgi:hypothetical protein
VEERRVGVEERRVGVEECRVGVESDWAGEVWRMSERECVCV